MPASRAAVWLRSARTGFPLLSLLLACGGGPLPAPAPTDAACEPLLVLTDLPDPRRIGRMGVDGSYVWLDQGPGGIWRIPKQGGARQAAAEAPPADVLRLPASEASDGRHRYKAEIGQGIVRTPMGGGASEAVAAADVDDDAFALALGGDFVYWTSSAGQLRRVAKTGGAITTLASLGPYDDDDFQGHLGIDESHVYFNGGPPGRRASDDDILLLARTCR